MTADHGPRVVKVSPAQFRVATALLHDGARDRELAARLHMATDTVKGYLKDLYLATGTGTRTELCVAVLRGRIRLVERET